MSIDFYVTVYHFSLPPHVISRNSFFLFFHHSKKLSGSGATPDIISMTYLASLMTDLCSKHSQFFSIYTASACKALRPPIADSKRGIRTRLSSFASLRMVIDLSNILSRRLGSIVTLLKIALIPSAPFPLSFKQNPNWAAKSNNGLQTNAKAISYKADSLLSAF